MKMYGTVGTGNGNGYVLITVAVAKMLAALYGRKEDKSYDHWTETQVWLVARGSLLIFFFFYQAGNGGIILFFLLELEDTRSYSTVVTFPSVLAP